MKTVGTLASVLGVAICGACGGTQDRPPLIDDFVTADRYDDDGQQGSGDVSDGGAGGDGGNSVTPQNDGRRLSMPCDAPFPTGYCAVSDNGDYIGGGKGYRAEGAEVVTITADRDLLWIDLTIGDAITSSDWRMALASPTQDALKPGLYEAAERAAFKSDGNPGFDFSGDGRGCNELSAVFSIEELQVDPGTGITRFSATFEQHCEMGNPALRGVVNFQASGVPDPTLVPDATIKLDGKVFRTAYSPQTHRAYGLDATNRQLVEINLAEGTTKQADTLQEGNALCIDEKRGRVYIVNKGSSLITEHNMSDLSLAREIEWAGTDWGPDETFFKIYCVGDKVYVVDAAWEPTLFTIEDLDEEMPVVVEHPDLTALGSLTFTPDGAELYYTQQSGWGAGSLNSFVARLDATNLMPIDTSAEDVPSFGRDPVDAPIFLDQEKSLFFARNVVFDASNLTKVVYTFPSEVDAFDGASENAYAFDADSRLLATKNFIYELERYSVVSPTIKRRADQLFFDRDGGLWFLEVASGTLEKQVVVPVVPAPVP